jgi:transglutaminase-like putative cysteine protease
MPLYRAAHTTRYLYETPVAQSLSETRLRPRTLPWQTVVESSIRTLPRAASVERRVDYFGNDVSVFAIHESHERFFTVATSLVRLEPRPAPTREATWESVRDLLSAHDTPGTLEAVEFVYDSPLVVAGPELAELAKPSFAPGRPLADAVEDLSRRIHDEFSYAPQSTTIDTPVLEMLRRRCGVCQDFTHVMIGALRSMRLSARYVSGYLRSGPRLQGAEASHAWVSVFTGDGWMDIDPTNDLRADTNHLTVAWGRDYADVPPVKGIATGGGSHRVEVEVRVEEIEDDDT